LQNIFSELRSHTGDCFVDVTVLSGIIVWNSVISAAHFAVQPSAPAPGSPPETPKRPWLSPVWNARGLAAWTLGRCRWRCEQASGARVPATWGRGGGQRTSQKQQACHHRVCGEAAAARRGRHPCKVLHAPPRDHLAPFQGCHRSFLVPRECHALSLR
jgi:hypothetical protein